MPRLLPTLMPSDLELRLLRKGLGELKDHRETCSDCGRTPLTGERLHKYDNGSVACELCRPAHHGEPTSTALVLHPEHGHTVKVRLRAA